MRKMKKLLSLILSFVMVFTLLQGIGSTTVHAANELEIDLLSTGSTGLKMGSKQQDVTAKSIRIGSNTLNYSDLKIVFNNGKYDLDPDDVIESGVNYTFTIKFTTPNASLLNGVSTAKIGVFGKLFDSSLDDYIYGNVSVVDTEVTVKATLKSYPKYIGVEELGKLAWNLAYAESVDSTAVIFDKKNVHYTAGTISWYYSDNADKTRKSVTKVENTADGTSKMYIAVVTLRANDGWLFRDYTVDELNSLSTTSDKYSYVMSSTSKRELTLTIKGLTPLKGSETKANALTEIDLDTEREFVYYKDYTAKDYLMRMSITDVRVATNGSQYATGFSLSDPNYTYWHLFTSTGTQLSDTARDLAPGTYYAAMPLSFLRSVLSRNKIEDTYGLLDVYARDNYTHYGYFPNLGSIANSWVVKVTILPAGSAETRPCYYDAPYFAFNKNTFTVNFPSDTIGKAWVTGCTGKGDYRQSGQDYTVSTNELKIEGAIVEGPMIYAAWGQRNANTKLSSPIVYRYYNSKDLSSGEATGTLSFNFSSGTSFVASGSYMIPVAGTELYKVGRMSIGTPDVSRTDMEQYLNLNKAFCVWSGKFDYNNGVTKFDNDQPYHVTVYVPIRDKFYPTNLKATFSVNGRTVTTQPVSVGTEGRFIYASYYFQPTSRAGFINARGVTKKLYFNYTAPVSGATVFKTLNLTASSARFASAGSVRWYEDGKDFSGSKFTAGKRYEAEVRIDASKGRIDASNSTAAQMLGDTKYVTSAYANPADQTITVRFNFGVCPTKTVKTIGDITLNFENGVSIDAFKAKLNEEKKVLVTFSDGTKEEVVVKPGFMPSSNTAYASFFDQFGVVYPNEKGYNPNKLDAQSFEIYGNVDLSAYGASERNLVLIKIKVAEGGCVVTFNANGGTYLGDATMVVKKGAEYGFKYIPSNIYREDYFFAGWYTEPEDGKGDRVKATSICKGSITLYAHWLKTFTGMVWNCEATSWSKGRLTIKWDQVKTKADGYEVAISLNGKDWEVFSAPMTRVKYIAGLKSGKKYYVRARAWRYDSTGKTHYGAWSKAVRAKVK